MDNLKIETIAERLFPEKFNEKLITHPSDPRKYKTPSQKFSAEVRQRAFTLLLPTINKNKTLQLLFQLLYRLRKTT